MYEILKAAVTKIPSTFWLKTIGICSPRIMEARSLKSKCHQGWFLSGGCEEKFVPCLSLSVWWLLAPSSFLGLRLKVSISASV